ncbi:MAG: hypothetical protein IT161_17950 [Bryobacterales bacterium]|nr:hypothetical protein [Bryobacterales bacterium]
MSTRTRTALQVKLYRSDLPIIEDGAAESVQAAAEAGGGVLRCFPSFVGRKFCLPGKNLELVDSDYFPEGPHGWAIDERWNGSAILADTGNGIHGEGLCHFHHPDGFLIPMDAAVHGAPAFMVGPLYRTLGGTGFYNKEFDNLYPLGHHMHPWKPEAYNFNPWRNKRYRNDCHTSVGLMHYMTEEMLAVAVRDFIAGKDNHLRSHARNLLIRMGTGFFTPTRILHGPAAVNTEEPQRDRDDFRFYQSHVLCPDGEVFLGQELLFRHLPEGLEGEDRVQRLVADIDLRRNKDPHIVEKHLLLPVVDREASQGGFHDEWRVYGRPNGDEMFSLRQFELAPRGETVLTGPAALCIIHFSHGKGKIGNHAVEVKSGIRLGEPLNDEFVIPYEAAKNGSAVKLINTSDTEPLVGTRCWGPEAWGHKMPKAPFETWVD